MKEIKVNYLINDEEYERLSKITEEYKKQGLDTTPERMFELIMTLGCIYNIDEKFKYHEWQLGLRENFLCKNKRRWDMSISEANSTSVKELETQCKEQGASLVIEGGRITGIIQEDSNVQTA